MFSSLRGIRKHTLSTISIYRTLTNRSIFVDLPVVCLSCLRGEDKRYLSTGKGPDSMATTKLSDISIHLSEMMNNVISLSNSWS
jgi:hypothetical protein